MYPVKLQGNGRNTLSPRGVSARWIREEEKREKRGKTSLFPYSFTVDKEEGRGRRERGKHTRRSDQRTRANDRERIREGQKSSSMISSISCSR